jgi:hypothetical protein
MYHQQEPEEEPMGCRDVFVVTRAAFGVLMWPLLALLLVMVGLGIVFYLFVIHPALALIPIGLVVLAAIAFARWEQRRSRPPGI